MSRSFSVDLVAHGSPLIAHSSSFNRQRRRNACRLGAPQPPGRSLEPGSNARPRGMAVLLAPPADRIRLTGPAATSSFFGPRFAPVLQGAPGAVPPSNSLGVYDSFKKEVQHTSARSNL